MKVSKLGALLLGTFSAMMIGSIVVGCAEHPRENLTVDEVNLDDGLETKAVKDYTPMIQKGQEAVMATQATLAQNLMSAMSEGGPVNAIEFCNLQAMPLTDSLSQVHQIKISRVSDKNRNPNNNASVYQLEMIDSMKTLMSQGLPLEPMVFEDSLHVNVQYPIVTAGVCLKCHGDIESTVSKPVQEAIARLYPEDKALGYQAGELRGLWVVQFEKELQ